MYSNAETTEHMQPRIVFFLTVAFVAIGLTQFFLYTQEKQVRNENYLLREHVVQLKAHVQRLESKSKFPADQTQYTSRFSSLAAAIDAHVLLADGIRSESSEVPSSDEHAATADAQEKQTLVHSTEGATPFSTGSVPTVGAAEDKARDAPGDKNGFHQHKTLLSIEDEPAQQPGMGHYTQTHPSTTSIKKSQTTATSFLEPKPKSDKDSRPYGVYEPPLSPKRHILESSSFNKQIKNNQIIIHELNISKPIIIRRRVVLPVQQQPSTASTTTIVTSTNTTYPPLHLPQCNRTRYKNVQAWYRNREKHSEEYAVYRNLRRCLSSAEMIEYFTNNSYRFAATRNAGSFLAMLRHIIPAQFNTTKYNIPCWESELDMHLCEIPNHQNITSPMKGLEGRMNAISFSTHESTCTTTARMALRSKYKGNATSSLLCLPTVFIAGFPKCGSSFLYCLVKKLVNMANPAYHDSELQKEPHFWVGAGPYFHHHYPPQPYELASYLFNFLPTAAAQLSSKYSLPIDGSPNLMFQWPRYSYYETIENYCLLPAIVPQILPNSKYIVVMRDPVTMLYSAFWFSCSTYDIKLSRRQAIEGRNVFHERVKKKVEIFQDCTLTKPIDACLVDIFPPVGDEEEFGGSLCGRVRLEVGFYYQYIRRWLSVVPRKQFLFLTSEELQNNTGSVANVISDFLELGVHNVIPSSDIFNSTRSECHNVQSQYNYRHDPLLQMRNDTREMLYKFFEPHNQKLAELLGDKKYLWKS